MADDGQDVQDAKEKKQNLLVLDRKKPQNGSYGGSRRGKNSRPEAQDCRKRCRAPLTEDWSNAGGYQARISTVA
jgi:hypothetical protein